jgi:hypothetical protein
LVEEYFAGYRLEVSPYPMVAARIEIIETVTGKVRNPFNVRIAFGTGRGYVRVIAEYLVFVCLPANLMLIAEGYPLSSCLRATG